VPTALYIVVLVSNKNLNNEIGLHYEENLTPLHDFLNGVNMTEMRTSCLAFSSKNINISNTTEGSGKTVTAEAKQSTLLFTDQLSVFAAHMHQFEQL